MTPIPKAAAPVVWFIRWWVKKPRTLPLASAADGSELRWEECEGRERCPMGLLPFSTATQPVEPSGAGLIEYSHTKRYGKLLRAVQAFVCWWDSQTDARAAVDAVWPE